MPDASETKTALQIQHNKKALLEALELSLGIVTDACKVVGVDRTTFYRYVKMDAEFAQAVEDVNNAAIDFVESALFKQIREGVPASTIFYLKTKAKHRGYFEKQELNVNSAVVFNEIENRLHALFLEHKDTVPDLPLQEQYNTFIAKKIDGRFLSEIPRVWLCNKIGLPLDVGVQQLPDREM